MNTPHILIATVLFLSAGMAQAAVGEEEAKQLGATLTPFGAEKAGNKEGTIPIYTGGLTTPPPTYKKGSGWRPDPFPEDKPLFSINAKNMDQYADKLTEGAKELMRKHPDYRIDVYPTRRTVAYPQEVLDNTVKNATRCKTFEEGLALEQTCRGGIPFPIPKNGHQVMWNHMLNYVAASKEGEYQLWFVNATGRPVMMTDTHAWAEYPYYDPKQARVDAYYRIRTESKAPARQAGVNTLIFDHMNPVETNRRAFSYLPGQRRVRVAPDFSYDTPMDSSGGVVHFDMINIFTGKMDRFDFKLLGKKEMYMPYNNYKILYETNPEEALGKHFPKPEVMRYELHRVWVVEATLKPGKRHVMQKSVFYWDEDNAGYGMADFWDASGKLYKSSVSLNAHLYESMANDSAPNLVHDFVKGVYVLMATPSYGGMGVKVLPQSMPSSFFSSESLAGTGVR
jgi:hypothetical protein